jgi:TolB-like protein/Flp pilus assembly protein TadD
MGEGAEKTSETVAQGAAAPVFISYASQDADTANQICRSLESQGTSCWIAPRDVKPGAQYADAIVRAITEAKAVVLVLSGGAVASAHVGREVERAASKRKPIIAYRVDLAPLSAALEYFLSQSQWIDVPALGMKAALVKLAEAVGHRSVSAPQAIETRKSTRLRKRIVIAAAVVVAVGVLVAAGVRYSLLGHKTATVAATTADKSIAVLPFVDMSEKRDQEYFGDGMAEEILDLLAKVPGLTVIGRTSSFQFKGKSEDLRTIGTKLNAAHVLEGSVRNSGDQIRITAQLINTLTGAHEWSETYDRHFGDVLKLQYAIAVAVARELQLTVVPADLDSRVALKNTEAYGLMLRGRHAFDRLDPEGFNEAVSLFQRALDLDPTLTDAASWLGRAYAALGDTGFLAPAEAYESARRMAVLALKLDPRSAEAHALLANIHLFYDWDWAAAEHEIQEAKSIAPGDPYAQRAAAILPMVLGQWNEAMKQLKAAVLIDPFDPINYGYLWMIQDRIGQLSEAESTVRRLLDISPASPWGRYDLVYLLLERGDREDALKEVQRETDLGVKQLGMAMVLYALGKKAESDAPLVAYIKEHADITAYSIADVYALRSQADEAMHWLERAFAQKDSLLLFIKSDTALVPLNDDSRYRAFLKKMNLPE